MFDNLDFSKEKEDPAEALSQLQKEIPIISEMPEYGKDGTPFDFFDSDCHVLLDAEIKKKK